MILHCMKKAEWEKIKNEDYFGQEQIEADGFIHCSSVAYFWRVAPNFRNTVDELILLCIEEEKLSAEVLWEDGDQCGRYYPHIYGLVEIAAVTDVLPFLKDSDGSWMKNPQLMDTPDK